MKISVNLLQESEQIASKVRRIGVLMQTGSIVLVVVFGIIVASLLSSTLFLSNRKSTLEEDIEDAKLAIESMRDVESKQFVVKQKIGFSQQVFQEYPSSHELLFTIFKFVTERATVSSIKISPSKGLISMSIKTNDVFSFVEFIKDLTSFSEEHSITRVLSKGFSRSEDGSYSFEVAISFQQEV